MQLRRMRASDLEFVTDTYEEIIRDNFTAVSVGRGVVRKRLAHLPASHQVWIAETARPVGWAWFELRPDEFTGFKNCILWNIYVRPEYRRKGIATELAQHVEKEARRQGADRITLAVTNHNKASLKLFDRAGYVKMRTVMQKPI